ncbi:MAG: hypothetical protein K2Q10_09250 [Rhodospirillales bacterium]|nr:hypothetical protein [Rhodospirillales bacterium]
MTVDEFEDAVYELEEIRIVVRISKNTIVSDFKYERKAAANTSVTQWLEARIKPLLNGVQVAVVSGNGTTPHGRTKLETLRASYES